MRIEKYPFLLGNPNLQAAFTPKDIASVTVWHEAAFYAGDMTDDGAGLISQWNDHDTVNGSAADDMAATGVNRPTYDVVGLNGGFPATYFDTSNLMQCPDSVDFDSPNSRSIKLVVSFDTITGSDQFLWRRYDQREMQVYLDSTGFIEAAASTTGAATDRLVRSAVPIIANAKYLVHVYWDGTNLGISVNGETPVTSAMATLNAGVSVTRIGSVSSFHTLGYMAAHIFANEVFTSEEDVQTDNYLYSQYWQTFTAFAAGDSLLSQQFTTGADDEFEAIAALYYRPDNIAWINGAVGGDSLLESLDVGNGWWDDDTGLPASELINFYAAVTGAPQAIVVSLGTNDRSNGATMTKTQFKTAYQAMIADMHTTYPDAKIFIQKIGRSDLADVNDKEENTQWIREAQNETIDELSYVYFGAESFDQPDTDGVHLTSGGYDVVAQRLARRASEEGGYTISGGTIGMVMASASQSAAVITVTVTHDAGTDFTPSTGIEGFTVTDDDVIQTINSAARATATTIDITLSATPTGTVKVYYMYGMENGINEANCVVDNSTNLLPLQATQVTST